MCKPEDADLIPRPQTVEEWAEMMPDVWREAPQWAQGIQVNWSRANRFTQTDYEFKEFAFIPRPKPPRMTDEEIDAMAWVIGLRAMQDYYNFHPGDSMGGFKSGCDARDAERTRLEKERGE